MRYLLLILLTGLLISGCGKKASDKPVSAKNDFTVDTTAFKTMPANNPNEIFSLEYKFEKGKHYKYRMALFSEDIQTMKTDSTFSQRVQQNLVYNLDVNVVNQEGDGTKEMNCEFTSIKINTDANGRQYNYESGITKDSTIISNYADYDAMVANPFSVRVGKYGSVIEIFRADKIADKYIANLKAGANITPDQKLQVKSKFTQGILKGLLANIFRQMTDKSLAKDSAWTFPQPTAPFLIFKIDNTNLYKISSLEMFNNDKIAVIDAGLKSVLSGSPTLKEPGREVNFKQPKLSVSGTVYFDITKGYIRKSTVKTNVDVYYTLTGQTPKGVEKQIRTEKNTNLNVVELISD